MSNTILIKRTTLKGKTPTELAHGELAVNTTDGNLWAGTDAQNQILLSGAYFSDTPPGEVVGATWWDTVNTNLFVWDGVEWSSVGDPEDRWSIAEHPDVDLETNPPVIDEVLLWDGTNWIPGKGFDPSLDETISGDWTFTNVIVAAAVPTEDFHLTNKLYTDTGDATTLSDGKAHTDAEISDLSDKSDLDDATTLASANLHTDTEITTLSDKSIADDATTLASANLHTDTEITTLSDKSIADDATTLASGKTYTDEEITILKTYTDGEIGDLSDKSDTDDATTLASANLHTDTEITALLLDSETDDAATLASAKLYTDGEITTLSDKSDVDDVTTLTSANTYTDDEITGLTIGQYQTITQSDVDDATTLASANLHTDTEITNLNIVQYETKTQSVADDITTLESAQTYTDAQISGLDIPLVARGTFGTLSGDLPATGFSGDTYWCEEDDYVSVNGGFTAMRADMVIWSADIHVRGAYAIASWRLIPSTDAEFANKTLDEVITGTWTFNNLISAPTAPTGSAHLANKSYVDTNDATTLASAKTYTGAEILTLRNYTDAEILTLRNYTDAEITALTLKSDTDDATTLASAKTYTDEEITTLKTYTDAEILTLRNYTDAEILTLRNYTDAEITALTLKSDTDDVTTLASANLYTDTNITDLNIAQYTVRADDESITVQTT